MLSFLDITCSAYLIGILIQAEKNFSRIAHNKTILQYLKLGQLKAAARWRDSALHTEYDFQVSAYTNFLHDINYKDRYRDMVCFFSQSQHLFLNLRTDAMG